MTEDDALHVIVEHLQRQANLAHYQYSYDLDLDWLLELHTHSNSPHTIRPLSGAFYAAAWSLCIRGILRPGVREYGSTPTTSGSAGVGFSITPYGRRWLAEATPEDHLPTDPSRYGALLAPFRARFGDGFHSRAQEAVRCFNAHTYLACCTMAGAAVESIVLAAAIAKTENEDAVLREYAGGSGRGRVTKALLGQAAEPLRRDFNAYSDPVKHWRDDAAHGIASTIGNAEAYVALTGLIRFASFVGGRWTDLTGRS